LEEYGGRVTVEQLICWLEDIGNMSARNVLCREYSGMNNSFTFICNVDFVFNVEMLYRIMK